MTISRQAILAFLGFLPHQLLSKIAFLRTGKGYFAIDGWRLLPPPEDSTGFLIVPAAVKRVGSIEMVAHFTCGALAVCRLDRIQGRDVLEEYEVLMTRTAHHKGVELGQPGKQGLAQRGKDRVAANACDL